MDNSFLKLYKNDFSAAVLNDNIAAYLTKWTGFVQQRPDETFLQYTNCKENIAFAGNLKVELVDVCEEVIQDITEFFFYTEFTDIFGVKQLRYEFGNIGADYGQELLFLKLTHTASNNMWYSAGFFITLNNIEETNLFHYGNTGYFRGFSYDKYPSIIFAPQWIRLQCFKVDEDIDKEGEDEIQLSGRRTSSRSLLTPTEKHRFNICDAFTHKRLVTLLNHDMIYLNNLRVSNKPMVEKAERVEDSNFFECSFVASVTEELLPEIIHVFPQFELIGKVPFGQYILSTIPGNLVGTFNMPFVMASGTIQIFRNGVLFEEFTEADVAVAGNTFTIDISALAFDTAEYYVNISEAMFSADTGLQEEFAGIQDTTTWPFYIINADYYGGDYEQTNYFTDN